MGRPEELAHWLKKCGMAKHDGPSAGASCSIWLNHFCVTASQFFLALPTSVKLGHAPNVTTDVSKYVLSRPAHHVVLFRWRPSTLRCWMSCLQ